MASRGVHLPSIVNVWCGLQGSTSDASSRDTATELLPSETSSLPLSVTTVTVSYEPADNTVSITYSPPRHTAPDCSPPIFEAATSGPRVSTSGYKEVPMSEPDLTKVPGRSALKGGKTRHLEEKQRDRDNQHHRVVLRLGSNTEVSPPPPLHPASLQFNSTGVLPKVPPKVAPKPKTGPWVQHFVFHCTLRILAELCYQDLVINCIEMYKIFASNSYLAK